MRASWSLWCKALSALNVFTNTSVAHNINSIVVSAHAMWQQWGMMLLNMHQMKMMAALTIDLLHRSTHRASNPKIFLCRRSMSNLRRSHLDVVLYPSQCLNMKVPWTSERPFWLNFLNKQVRFLLEALYLRKINAHILGQIVARKLENHFILRNVSNSRFYRWNKILDSILQVNRKGITSEYTNRLGCCLRYLD